MTCDTRTTIRRRDPGIMGSLYGAAHHIAVVGVAIGENENIAGHRISGYVCASAL